MDFEDEAKRACETKLEDAKSTYPKVEEANLPYLCMDLVYQFTLLIDGFGKLPRPNLIGSSSIDVACYHIYIQSLNRSCFFVCCLLVFLVDRPRSLARNYIGEEG